MRASNYDLTADYLLIIPETILFFSRGNNKKKKKNPHSLLVITHNLKRCAV